VFLGKTITFDEGEAASAVAADMSITVQNSGLSFIEKLKAGDHDAFEFFVNKYSGDVFGLAYRLTEDHEDANDITQETFLSAVRGIGSFRGDAELKTWLFRIAINHSRNRFRWWKRRKYNRTVSLDAPIGESGSTEIDLIKDTRDDPEQNTLTREREQAILCELGKLPLAFREAVVLCDIEGYSYEEVSLILGVGIGTVKSRIARGRGTLRERLKGF
jgi:RNA polymerase sigma-70 factor, ECF subfamily